MKFLVSKKLENIIKSIVYKDKPFVMDIDDVILDFKDFFRENLNESFDVNISDGEIVVYDVYKLIPLKRKGIKKQDVFNAVRKMGKKSEFLNLSLNYGIEETINYLINDGDYNNFFINTSRSKELYDNYKIITYETLNRTGLKFNKYNVIFDSEKEHIAKALGAVLFFEDNPMTALKIIKKNIPVILLNHEWNYKSLKDTYMLDNPELMEKYELIDELRKYEGDMLFRIDSFEDFSEYLSTII
ncbi:MAG: hypothetical protein QXL18_02420 [Candidatus Woesearchaeota archaeon]